MNAKRDIIIERLEEKLKKKERELKDVKNELKNELKNDLKNEILHEVQSDLGPNKELASKVQKLDDRVSQLNSEVEGVMNELLDQKSLLKELRSPRPKPPRPPEDGPDKPDVRDKDTAPRWPKRENKVRMTVREHPPQSKQKPEQKREDTGSEDSGTEYIVANSSKKTPDFNDPPEKEPSRKEGERETEYIIADRKKQASDDEELVTTREDQDVVIMERRKG